MQFAVWIVSPAGFEHSEAFRETAEAIDSALRELGHESVVSTSAVPHRINIILGANLLLPTDPMPERAIIYNLEQITAGSPWMTSQYLGLLGRSRVWDYSATNVRELANLGITVRHVPLGGCPEWTRIPRLPETIDVLFYGSPNERRHRILEDLFRRGLRVEGLMNGFGAARDDFIARSKIVLNMHYFDSQIFEFVRVGYLLANRRCVVSELSLNAAEDAPFAHSVAFAPYDRLVATCHYLIDHEAERRRLEAAGFELMSKRRQVDYLRDPVAELLR